MSIFDRKDTNSKYSQGAEGVARPRSPPLVSEQNNRKLRLIHSEKVGTVKADSITILHDDINNATIYIASGSLMGEFAMCVVPDYTLKGNKNE